MALSLNELLIAVDEMELYKKDYDVIRDLLNSGDDEFFVKVFEEVLMGNLYWSDFEHNLANTNYGRVLKEQLQNQKELNDEIRKLILLRKASNSNYEYKNNEMTIGIVEQYVDNDKTEERLQDFYKQELATIRGNLLYDLTAANEDDTVLETAFKTKIYNAIRNGEIVLQKINGNKNFDGLIPAVIVDDKEKTPKFLVTETEILVGDPEYKKVDNPNDNDIWSYYEKSGTSYIPTDDVRVNSEKEYFYAEQTKHEYINPNDIFLNIQNYIIPVRNSHITLDSFDRAFMAQHNIQEDTMKTIKMNSMLLRMKNFSKEEANDKNMDQ